MQYKTIDPHTLSGPRRLIDEFSSRLKSQDVYGIKELWDNDNLHQEIKSLSMEKAFFLFDKVMKFWFEIRDPHHNKDKKLKAYLFIDSYIKKCENLSVIYSFLNTVKNKLMYTTVAKDAYDTDNLFYKYTQLHQLLQQKNDILQKKIKANTQTILPEIEFITSAEKSVSKMLIVKLPEQKQKKEIKVIEKRQQPDVKNDDSKPIKKSRVDNQNQSVTFFTQKQANNPLSQQSISTQRASHEHEDDEALKIISRHFPYDDIADNFDFKV